MVQILQFVTGEPVWLIAAFYGLILLAVGALLLMRWGGR